MAKIKRYEDSIAWQKSMDLVVAVYQVTDKFPAAERFGLVQQMRRAGVSISSNIAEGWSRRSRADLIRFLEFSHGSAYELQTQARIAARLELLPDPQSLLAQIAEVERLLAGLIRSLYRKDAHEVVSH